MAYNDCNILDYIVQQSGAKPRTLGNKILIDPCPVCKIHKGHFYIYPKTNSYYSFAGCCNGGSLVDWLVEYEKIPLKEALQRVRGDLKESLEDKAKREENQRLAKLLIQKIEGFFNACVAKYKAFKEAEDELKASGAEYTDPHYRWIRQAVRFYDRLTDQLIFEPFEKRVRLMQHHYLEYFFKLKAGDPIEQ